MENLKLIRIKKKYTQSSVAKSAGVSTSTYRRWERGDQEPTYTQLCKLARVFGLPGHKFFRFLEGTGLA